MTCNRAREIDLASFIVDSRAAEWAEFRDHYPRCADCAREVAQLGTLVATLQDAGANPGAHLTEQQLLALSTAPASLGVEEREKTEAHLANCAPCRTELASVRDFDWSAVAAPAQGPGWLERFGAALFPALPRPVLAAALAVLVALPAYLVWRVSIRGAEAPRLARIEEPVKAAPSPPAPIEVAKPIEQEPPPPEPEPKREAPVVREKPAPAPLAPTPVEPAPEPRPAQKPPPEPEPRPIEIAALLPSEAPRYLPGALAGGASVRIGGAARSTGAAGPTPQVLAPAHLGRTAHESPTLYFFLPDATTQPVEVTVTDPNAVDPLLEARLAVPLAAGVHAIRLSDRGVRLAPGVDYQWFVTVVADPSRRSNDVVSGAQIRYTPAPELASLEPVRRAHAYAEAGLWYDAFDQLSAWLLAEPDAAILHQHRAALLEQVGLAEAASYERIAPGAE